MCVLSRSHLLALHRTAVLRHDEYGQETLLNLLLRNYLHYNLYDQVEFCTCLMPGGFLQVPPVVVAGHNMLVCQH
jgi:hypothetical protein